MGTHTNNTEQDYLMVVKVRMPMTDTSSDVKDISAAYSKVENKIEIETRINHQGEVNKARPMPNKDRHNIIATKTNSGEVHVFDYHKLPPKPKDNQILYKMKLLGHTKEGYGLNWSLPQPGLLISGSDDNKVKHIQ
jgi:histone-binding protein RBBP4